MFLITSGCLCDLRLQVLPRTYDYKNNTSTLLLLSLITAMANNVPNMPVDVEKAGDLSSKGLRPRADKAVTSPAIFTSVQLSDSLQN